MSFWSAANGGLEPLRKYNFEVSIGKDFKILAKSVNKPTLETDVNEYKLLNQIIKFPSVPKWNDITVKYVDIGKGLTESLKLMMGVDMSHGGVEALKKGSIPLTITGYDTNGEQNSQWTFTNAFIKSIDYGDYDYSSDDLVEVTVVFAYDWAKLT